MTLHSQNLEEEIKNRMEKYDIELEDRADDLQRLQAKRAVKCKELEDLVLLVCFKITIDSA
jgi:hypothetical protein